VTEVTDAHQSSKHFHSPIAILPGGVTTLTVTKAAAYMITSEPAPINGTWTLVQDLRTASTTTTSNPAPTSIIAVIKPASRTRPRSAPTAPTDTNDPRHISSSVS
jgi:hypothetical protein